MPTAQTRPEQRALADQLYRTRWAHGMQFSQVEYLAGYLQVREARQGEVVVQEGERAAFLCWIIEGKVEVQKRSDDGSLRTLGTLGRGSTIGEMSILDGEPRSDSVVATSPTTLLLLDAKELQRLTHESPGLAAEFYRRVGKGLSQKLRRTSGALVEALG